MPPKKAAASTSAVAGPSTAKVKGKAPVKAKPKAGTSAAGAKKEALTAVQRMVHGLVSSVKGKGNGQMSASALLTAQELQAVDQNEILTTINQLLKLGLLKVFIREVGGEKTYNYAAVDVAEARSLGGLDTDEKLVYDTIAGARNEGIWLRKINQVTNLHDSTTNKALKTLTSKGLIKLIKDVKYPTRKIYMLSSLSPSASVSGGPWHSGTDLDEDFIAVLLRAIGQYIIHQTFGKQKANPSSTEPRPLYTTNYASQLPHAQDVLEFIKDHGLTTEQLRREDVEELVEVLVFEGYVEKVTRMRRLGEEMEDDEMGEDDFDNGMVDVDEEDEEEQQGRPKKRLKLEDGMDEDDNDMEEAVPEDEEDENLALPDLPPPISQAAAGPARKGRSKPAFTDRAAATPAPAASTSRSDSVKPNITAAPIVPNSLPRKRPPPGNGPYFVYRALRRRAPPQPGQAAVLPTTTTTVSSAGTSMNVNGTEAASTGAPATSALSKDPTWEEDFLRGDEDGKAKGGPGRGAPGWMDSPCGACPVARVCDNRGAPVVVDQVGGTADVARVGGAAGGGADPTGTATTSKGGRWAPVFVPGGGVEDGGKARGTGRGVVMSSLVKRTEVLQIGGAVRKAAVGGDAFGWGESKEVVLGEDSAGRTAKVRPGACRYLEGWLDY